jgi:hypothetical protein
MHVDEIGSLVLDISYPNLPRFLELKILVIDSLEYVKK